MRSTIIAIANHNGFLSAGQVGPGAMFFGNPSAPEHADIGKAMFESEAFEDWSSLFDVSLAQETLPLLSSRLDQYFLHLLYYVCLSFSS